MSVYGRFMWDWDYATYVMGPGQRRRIIAKHFSRTAADRAFKQYRKAYGAESRNLEYENYRCWQETRSGEIINETPQIDPEIYA